jgi:hypothetical protein
MSYPELTRPNQIICRDPAQPQLVAQLDQSFVLYRHPASTAVISSS